MRMDTARVYAAAQLLQRGQDRQLMAAIGLFNYFNRFNDLLEMEPTQPASAEALATAGINVEAGV
jgi:hypothetical protein